MNQPMPARLLESQGNLGMLQKAPQATQCSHTSKSAAIEPRAPLQFVGTIRDLNPNRDEFRAPEQRPSRQRLYDLSTAGISCCVCELQEWCRQGQ